MNETTRTASMLQRVPVILAVTAASYGLHVPAQVMRWSSPSTASAQRIVHEDDAARRPLPQLQALPATRL